MTDYFANTAIPPGSTGAGTEPVPRQYGVWGAYFNGTCITDSTPPTCGASPVDPNCTTGLVNPFDYSPSGAVALEIQYGALHAAYPNGFDANTIVAVFTQGWPYNPGSLEANHNSISSTEHVAVIPTDFQDYTISSHELIEGASDPILGTAWVTTPQVQGCFVGNELCDGGAATLQVTLQSPLSDGFGDQNHSFILSDSVDNIDGSAVFGCPFSPGNSCSALGNIDQCPNLASPPVQPVYDGNGFTNVTTTPPVAVVAAAGKINVITRTRTGILHLVPGLTSGGPFTQLSPPIGTVTETPAVFSSDGVTMDMFGRGTDGALYEWTYNGSSWSGPFGHGGYMNGPPSAAFATVNGTPTTAVLVLATTGQIAAYVNGTWSFPAMPANVLAISPPQIFRKSSTILDAYFTGTDGKVYRQVGWPNGSWSAVPTSASAFGLVDEVYDVVAGKTIAMLNEPVGAYGSQLLYTSYVGGVGTPGFLPTLTATGPVSGYYQSNGQMKIFATGVVSGGTRRLFVTASDTSGLNFSNWTSLVGQITSPPVAFSPDNSSSWIFARSPSAGGVANELVYWYWNGSSWGATNAPTGVSIM